MIRAFSRLVVGAALGACALLSSLDVVACQRVALLAPPGSTITLMTLVSTLPLSGTTNLIAKVIEPARTQPHRGTLVTFMTSLGTIEPAEAETDPGGRVMVAFRAGSQSVTATITAFSGGVTTGTMGAVKIAVGAAGGTTIVLTATPPTIVPGGKSTVTATVSDVAGTSL